MIYSDSAYVVNTFDKGWIYNWAKNDWTKENNNYKELELKQRTMDEM